MADSFLDGSHVAFLHKVRPPLAPLVSGQNSRRAKILMKF